MSVKVLVRRSFLTHAPLAVEEQKSASSILVREAVVDDTAAISRVSTRRLLLGGAPS